MCLFCCVCFMCVLFLCVRACCFLGCLFAFVGMFVFCCVLLMLAFFVCVFVCFSFVSVFFVLGVFCFLFFDLFVFGVICFCLGGCFCFWCCSLSCVFVYFVFWVFCALMLDVLFCVFCFVLGGPYTAGNERRSADPAEFCKDSSHILCCPSRLARSGLNFASAIFASLFLWFVLCGLGGGLFSFCFLCVLCSMFLFVFCVCVHVSCFLLGGVFVCFCLMYFLFFVCL